MKVSRISTAFWILTSALLFAAMALAQPGAPVVVSSASFKAGVSPDSLASIFGENLASGSEVAALNGEGEFPESLLGVKVWVADMPARLLFVSPNQINLVIPGETPVGIVEVRIETATGTKTTATAVSPVAPGIYYVDALRLDRAAMLNGSTFSSEPFSGLTFLSDSGIIQTRLSLYGTGWRHAADGGQSNAVEVIAVDRTGKEHTLPVEYADAAPGFAGLDQLNATIPDELRQLGLLSVSVVARGVRSNAVSFVMNEPQKWEGSVPNLRPQDLSSVNEEFQLLRPVDVAWAADGNLFIADPGARSVFRIDPSGTLHRFAGSGEDGDSGDGAPALAARFRSPSAVHVDAGGDVYVVDRDANRVRVIGRDGIIRAFAGNGTATYSGDGGLAKLAGIRRPSDLLTLPDGTVVIADTENHRLRAVTRDGRIQTLAGTGESGLAVDGNLAFCASISLPTSLALGIDGTIFVLESGNNRVVRLTSDSRVIALGGRGNAPVCDECGIADLPVSDDSRLATDSAGRLYVTHREQGRVYAVDSAGVVRHLAGEPAGAENGERALETRIGAPLGLSVRLDGTLFVADANGSRVQEFADMETASCGTPTKVVFEDFIVLAGQTVRGSLYVACKVDAAREVQLQAFQEGLLLPAAVTIPPGSDNAPFEAKALDVESATVIQVGVKGSEGELGRVRVDPTDDRLLKSLTLRHERLFSGQSSWATIQLGRPAPAGGLLIGVSGQAVVAPGLIAFAEGATSASFGIFVPSVHSGGDVSIVATWGQEEVSASLRVDVAEDCTECVCGANSSPASALIGDFSITPSSVTTEREGIGKVTLVSHAGPGGVSITVVSNHPAVTVPTAILIEEGGTSADFPVYFTPVDQPTTAVVTVFSENSLDTTVSLSPTGAGQGTIGSLSVSPNPVTSGSGATGTVALTNPAPAGGVLVTLSSNNGNASVPASIVIPAGETQGTFAVSTTPVASTQVATITATSANVATTDLTLNPPSAGQETIGSLTVSPNAVTSGSGATGTVTLTNPAPAGGLLVTLSSNNGNASVPASIVIPAGETQGTFAVSTTPVASTEVATITATSANVATTDLTLDPPSASQGTIGSLTISPNPVTSGSGATGTVTLTNPASAGGVLVTLSSNNGNASVPASILIPAGETQGTFAVSTTPVAATEVATITATSANVATTDLTLNPPSAGEGTIGSLTVSPNPVTSGSGATGTVTLTNAAPAGGVLVTLASNNGNASVPASMVIPAGETQGTFAVSTTPVASTEVATITATSENVATTDLTLNPPSAGQGTILSLSVEPTLVQGGAAATGTVTLDSAAGPGGVLVSLSDDSAHASVPSSIIIAAGSTHGSFAITTTTVTSLQVATITATSANQKTATISIDVDDPCVNGLDLDVSITNVLTGAGVLDTTVTLDGPAPFGGRSVNLVSGAVTLGSVFIPQGETSGSAQVSVANLFLLLGSTLQAILGDCPGIHATISAETPILGSLQVPASLTLGSHSAAMVTLYEPAPAGGAVVQLTAARSGILSTLLALLVRVDCPSSVFIPEGEVSANFDVGTTLLGILPLGLDDLLGTIHVEASLVTTRSGDVVITKD